MITLDTGTRLQMTSLLMSRPLLGVWQRPRTLAEPKAFGTEVFGVTAFAVDLAVLVGQGGGLQAFATLSTAETALVPSAAGSHHLLCSVHSFAAARAYLRAAKLLRKFGCVWVVGGTMCDWCVLFDAQ